MEFKKKEAVDHRSKKILKERELLMSPKRQLNVVLSREMIPRASPVLFIDKKLPDNSQSVILNEDSYNKGGSISDKDNPEMIMHEPKTSPQTVNLGQSHDVTCGNQSSKLNSSPQPPPSNNKKELHKLSVQDFRSLIQAATEQAIIKLAIDNPGKRNVQDDLVEDIIFDDLDSEPISKLFCSLNNDDAATTYSTKEKEKNLPKTNLMEVDQQCGILVTQDISHKNTGFNENKTIQNETPVTNDLPSNKIQEKAAKDPDNTLANKTLLKKQEKQKDNTLKTQTGDSGQDKDHLILKFEKRCKVKPIKREIHNETEKNEQSHKQKEQEQNNCQSTWKIKKTPKTYLKPKVQIVPAVDTSHAIQNKTEQISLKPNKYDVILPSKNFVFESQDQPNLSEDVVIPTLDMKRSRGRPLKNKLLKNETEKRDVSSTKVNYDVPPINVSSDTKKNEDEEVNKKINETKKCHATEGSQETQMGPSVKKNVRQIKSIELQLQFLRKQMVCLSRSQNRILAILEHLMNDRSEHLGKTFRFEGVASF